MPVVTLTLDTACAGQSDIEDFILGGEVISAAGLINLKWEDFSAIDAARSVGLQEIAWQGTYDDTPGSLSLTVRYSNLTGEEAAARFENRYAVDDYEIQPSPVLPSQG